MSKESMGIVRLDVENIQRIKAVKVKPTGSIVKITGKNEAGKSSVLDAIEMALGGRGKLSKMPVRKGADKGTIRMMLGVARLNDDGTPVKNGKKVIYDEKYLITKVVRSSGTDSLKITTPDESATYEKKKQALLNSFLSDFTFDPLVFAEADPKVQQKMVMQVSKVDVDVDKLREMSGVAVFEIEQITDPNEYFKSVLERLKDDRKSFRKQVEKLETLMTDTKAKIPEGMETVDKVNIATLLQQRKAQEELGNAKAEAKSRYESFRNEWRSAAKTIEHHKESISATKAEIENIKARLKEQEETLVRKMEQLAEDEKVLAEMTEQGKKTAEEIEAMVDPAFDEIDEALEKAEYTNEIAGRVIALERHQEQIKANKDGAADAQARLDKVLAYREKVYQDGEFPVEDIGFTEEGDLIYEGIPIEQRGRSRRIIIGCHVCASANPTLRVILVRAGNELDEDNMKALAEWAEDHAFQIWIEHIASGPQEDAFYIEDGTTYTQGDLFKEEGANDKSGDDS